MMESEFNEWSTWLVENYDPRLPITITVPFRQGKFIADAQLDAAMLIIEKLIESQKLVSDEKDEITEGYKIMANDTEAYRRKSPSHHCGFDFSDGVETATCNCGAVATNPYYMEQPPRTPKELWDEAVAYGKAVEHDMILDRTYDDEIMHNIWWVIKREDKFPSQGFIADVIRNFLLIKKDK